MSLALEVLMWIFVIGIGVVVFVSSVVALSMLWYIYKEGKQ